MVSFIFPAEMMPDVVSSTRRFTTSPRCRLLSMMCRPSSCRTRGGELSRKEIWTCPRGSYTFTSQKRERRRCFAGAVGTTPCSEPSERVSSSADSSSTSCHVLWPPPNALVSSRATEQGGTCYRDDSQLARVRDQRDRVLEISLCTPLSALHSERRSAAHATFVDIGVFCAVIACPGRVACRCPFFACEVSLLDSTCG